VSTPWVAGQVLEESTDVLPPPDPFRPTDSISFYLIDPRGVRPQSFTKARRSERAMRIHFHLTNGRDLISDEGGVEVTDMEVAQRHTLETIAQLHGEADIDPREWNGWWLVVTTASGAVVFRIDLSLH